jgi:diguanylate cyclase (GGDEF)-like protein
MSRLYTRHFCPAQSAVGVRQSAQSSLEQLDQARALLGSLAGPNVVLAKLDEVAEQLRAAVAGAQAVVARLTQSEQRIALLEGYLNDATRDASTDALTGLFNRRAFDAAVRTMAAEAMNSGTDLAFILLDVDHFKHVNDEWGHPVGDEVLRHVASLLTRTVRGGDIVARYGGEEFAVILAETGRRAAVSVAENLREAVCSHPFLINDTADGRPVEACLRITISAGISCFTPGEAISQWTARADAALYRAKHAGRDRVMFSTAATHPVGQSIRPARPASGPLPMTSSATPSAPAG